MTTQLNLVSLLHQITQAGYQVQFHSDFEGMIRIEFYEEYNPVFYHHSHLGSPDGTMEDLQKSIVNRMKTFVEEFVDKQ